MKKRTVIIIVAMLFTVAVLPRAEERIPFLYENPAIISLLREYHVEMAFTEFHRRVDPWSELIGVRAPVEAFHRLLALGADVNLNPPDGTSPLSSAISSRNGDIVEFFLRHGADVRRPDRRGETPLVHAARFGTPRILELLINAGAGLDASDALPWVFVGGGSRDTCFEEMARILIDGGADVNAVSPGGSTPLMTAAGNMPMRPEAIRFLISAGADVNAVNANGQSALILAAANLDARPLTIEILLEAGADARIEDNTGRTALDWFDLNRRLYRHPVRRELRDRTL
jgi:ankyrin repeat protein